VDAHNGGLEAQNGSLEQCCFDETYNFFLVKTDFYVAGIGAGTQTVICQNLEQEPYCSYASATLLWRAHRPVVADSHHLKRSWIRISI